MKAKHSGYQSLTKMYFFLLISTLIVAANAIADGKNASIEEFPYHVSLENESSEYLCGGTIIDKNWVITTSQCAAQSVQKIRAGTSLREKGGSLHRVDKVIKHERSALEHEIVPVYDIALMHVVEPFEFDKTRRTVDLFKAGEEIAPQTMSNLTGFGMETDKFFNGELSENLRWIQIPTIWSHLCDRAYQYHYDGLPQGTMCAGWNDIGGQNACSGDEGSPLVIGGRLAGIVSWSYNCVDPYYPPVYTQVSYYRDWIDQHLQI